MISWKFYKNISRIIHILTNLNCNTSDYQDLKTSKTVFSIRTVWQITVRFYVFIIEFCDRIFPRPANCLRICEIFIPCCLAMLVEAALQLCAWKMLTSMPAFYNSPFIHLDRVSEEASLWGFPYVILSLPWLPPFSCFVHLYRVLNNLQYVDFHSHWSCDILKVLMNALDWCFV